MFPSNFFRVGSVLRNVLAISCVIANTPIHSAYGGCDCGDVETVHLTFKGSVTRMLGPGGKVSVEILSAKTQSESDTEPAAGTVGSASTKRDGQTEMPIEKQQTGDENEPAETTVTAIIEPGGTLGAWNTLAPCQAGSVTCDFTLSNACGYELEVYSSLPGNPSTVEWHVAETATLSYSIVSSGTDYNSPMETQEVEFKIRLKKKDSSGGLTGALPADDEISSTVPPEIPEDMQDSPPATGGLPQGLTPMSCQSSVRVKARPSSGLEGGETRAGTIMLKGPISPSIVNVNQLEVLMAAGQDASTFRMVMASGVGPGQRYFRQVKTPGHLADIQQVSGGSIEIRQYEDGQFDPDGGGSLFTIYTGQVAPNIVRYTPIAPAGDHFGGVRVTTIASTGVTHVRDILSTSTDGLMARIIQDGLETQDMVSVFTYNGGVWERSDQVSVTREGHLVSKSTKVYRYLVSRLGSPSVVVGSVEYLQEERELVNATTGEELVTSHFPDPEFQDKDRYVVRPDGSWVAYNYYTGMEVGGYPEWRGFIKETLRPFGVSITDPASATSANSESTIAIYSTPDSSLSRYEVVAEETTLPGAGTIHKWERTYSDSPAFYLFALLESAGYSTDWSSALVWNVKDDSRVDYASAGETIKASSLSIKTPDGTFPQLNGKPFASVDAEGTGIVTGYEQGNFVASTGAFTADSDPANATGSYIRSMTLSVANYSEIPVAQEATKTIVIADLRGLIYRRELWVLDGSSNWSQATVTTFDYPTLFRDGRPAEITEKHDGRIIKHTVYSGSSIITEDEQGIKTTTAQDLIGRTGTVTREGAGSYPDIVTTYSYNGSLSTSVTSAGGISRTTTSVVDLADRTIEETDSSTAVTSIWYPNGGRDKWTTLPGGLTEKVIGRIDGRIGSIIGTATVPEFYSYSVSTGGATVGNMVTSKFLGTAASPRYVVTESDWAGREIRRSSPSPTGTGEVSEIFSYLLNTRRLESKVSPAGAIVYGHPDSYSSATLSGYDVDGGGLATGGSDRVMEVRDAFAFLSGYWWQVSTRRVFDVNGSSASAVTNTSKRCLHGNPGSLASWTIDTSPFGGTTESKRSIDRSSKTVIRTEVKSGLSINAVSVDVNGLIISTNDHDSTNPTRSDYNSLGELFRQVSPRGEVSYKSYNADGSLATSTDHYGKVTSYLYYGPTHASAGKLQQITNPLLQTTVYTYTNLGEVESEAGTSAYKVTYEYDSFGALKKMFTWPDGVTPHATEWIYQDGTGLLLSKKDAASQHVDYTYYSSRKLASRTWARNISTTYSYSTYGDLTIINYSDSTPDVELTNLDRLGRPATIKQGGVITEQLTYHPGKDMVNARFNPTSNPQLAGLGIRYSAPDSWGRPLGFTETSASNATSVRPVSYSYDSLGRLDTITDGSQNHVYSYWPNSSLVSTINSRSGTTSWFRESRYYDAGPRLIGVRSDRMSGASLLAEISAHAYDYDDLGRRTKNTFQDGARYDYGYDDLSQVVSSTRKNSGGTDIPQLGASYSYDGIGNRLTSNSPILGSHTYASNSLNQYSSITTSSGRTAVGRAPSSWNVQVAGVNATRIGDLYYRDLTASNTSVPVWQSVITKRDTGTPTTTNNFWYAKTPTVPTYDLDGNLTNDGRWTYVWDAENRLIQIETTAAATTAGQLYTKLKFVYDWEGHRVARNVWKGGSAGSPAFLSSRRWIYDGWNVIAEFSAASETTTTVVRLNTFTWGSDLSGTMQGAGGVGGLLTQNTVSGGVIERASCDGNGNIVAWTKSNASAPTSRREYDACGNTLLSEGSVPCNIGFSTKMQDGETGLYYYGFRFYDPVHGRWINKDPLEEEGGTNLYGFLANNGVNEIDLLGLQTTIETTFLDVIAKGSSAELATLIEASGDCVSAELLANAEAALARKVAAEAARRLIAQRLQKTAEEIIAQELKGSVNKEFPKQLAKTTLEQIKRLASQGNKPAQKAWKLLNDNRFKK